MPKRDFGTAVSKCEICGINQWDSCGGKPAIWPCNVQGCPYENPLAQNLRESSIESISLTGSGLAQIEF